MKKLAALSLAVLFTTALAACAPTTTTTTPEKKPTEEKMVKPLSASITALNNSGQTGNASISESNGKTKVVVSIGSGAKDVGQPAHIHAGSCPQPGSVLYPLTNVMNGSSTSTVDASLDKVSSQMPLAVVVHKSEADINTYVACGDVTK